MMMKINEFVERVSASKLVITGRTTVGFGLSAEYAQRYDEVEIVPSEEFARLAEECKPSGHHTIGCNRGAPVDGLYEYVGKTGIRYLVDGTGPGIVFRYADAATVPFSPT